MKDTLKNKCKFFAQYWGQNILMTPVSDGVQRSKVVGLIEDFARTSFLKLKSLSEISDEDAIEVSRIYYYRAIVTESDISTFIKKGRTLAVKFHESRLDVADFLRSKGYAIPYNGLSINKQEEWGWAVSVHGKIIMKDGNQ